MYLSQLEFCRWYHEADNAGVKRIIQDMNGRLNRFCDIPGVASAWIWPHDLHPAIREAEPGTLIVIETGQKGRPMEKYDAALLERLENPEFYLMRRDRLAEGPARWMELLGKVSSRNPGRGWRVYEKR